MKELINNVLSSTIRKEDGIYMNTITGSWGIRQFVNYSNKLLRFTVSGKLHKGFVYIALDYSDTFDVYLTAKNHKLVTTFEGIYLDNLVEVIDHAVESGEGD